MDCKVSPATLANPDSIDGSQDFDSGHPDPENPYAQSPSHIQATQGSIAANTGTSPAAPSPAGSISTQIGPNQPLTHDAGLLSLANSIEPKYLGRSSGVTFARLIFAAAPQMEIPSANQNSVHRNQAIALAGRAQRGVAFLLAQGEAN